MRCYFRTMMLPVLMTLSLVSLFIQALQEQNGAASTTASSVTPINQDSLKGYFVQNSSNNIAKVLFLQKSGVPSAESYARLVTPFPTLQDFTLCYRIRLHRFREESTLISYATADSKDNEIRIDHRDTGYFMSIHSKLGKSTAVSPINTWAHYCVTFNGSTQGWLTYEDGVFKVAGSLPAYNGPLDGGGVYILGQEQDSLGGGFNPDQSFSGEITEMNFWKEILDEKAIHKVFACEEIIEGNSLAWSQLQWKLKGEAEWFLRDRKEFCKTFNPHKVAFFPDRYNFGNAIKFCEVVGGTLSVPASTEENNFLYKYTMNHAENCSGNTGSIYLWLGANDIKTEGSWVYTKNSTALLWQGPWRGGAPNGGRAENCLAMLYGEFAAQWNDIACLNTYSFCVPCNFEKSVILYLKGPLVCSTSPFNHEYFLEGEKNGKPLIAGIYHSEIYWEATSKYWNLRSLKYQDAFARYFVIDDSQGLYPFGLKQWVAGTDICGIQHGEAVNLTLSICGTGLFTCHDGSCISLSKRCDLRVDCLDQSDEAGCSLIDFPNGYKNTVVPPTLNSKEPLNIFLYINVISFPNIKTQDLVFETTLQLILRWKDIRLNYKNLKDDSSLNLLPQDTVQIIWLPKIFFANAYGNIFTNQNEGSRVECILQGDSVPGPLERAEEMNIFSGKENSLETSQHYQASYACDFDLLMFPFDIQICFMDFMMVSASRSYVVLIPQEILYKGNINLMEYTIGNLSANSTNIGEFSSVRVKVSFMRRYGFYLLTVYIPSVLMVIIAYCSMYFDPADFNSRITISLTAMLVLSSLYSQTTNSLPKTSYYKLIDIWLFFSTAIIFAVVLFQTIVEYYSYDPPKKDGTFPPKFILKERKHEMIPGNRVPAWQEMHVKYTAGGIALPYLIMYAGRVCIPSLFVLFNAVYWGVAVRYLTSNVWTEDKV